MCSQPVSKTPTRYVPAEGNVRVDPSIIFFIPLVLLLVFMFSAQRKRQRAFATQQAALTAGQDIVTTSGLFAHLVEIDETVAVLEISPGQQVRWDRRAIASVVSAPAAASYPATNPTNTNPQDSES